MVRSLVQSNSQVADIVIGSRATMTTSVQLDEQDVVENERDIVEEIGISKKETGREGGGGKRCAWK